MKNAFVQAGDFNFTGFRQLDERASQQTSKACIWFRA